MSNPTTPFSWQMPTATDLVTDLPADFAVFGQAVATSMADLLGGTTGQVLAKTTSTDMDFTWTTPQVGDITGVTAGTGISGGGTSGTVTVTNDMATTITTNGDLIYGTGSGTYTRRAIGSTSQVLTVAGGIPTWATPATPTAVGCLIYNSANFTIANNAETKLTFDTEIFDTDGFHSTVTNTSRITIPAGKGGKYYVVAWGAWSNNSTGYRQFELILNNKAGAPTRVGNASMPGGTSVVLTPNGIANLIAGDYLEMQVYQNSGGNLTLYGGISELQFGVIYLGA